MITLIFMRREILNETTHRKWGEAKNYKRSLSQINRLAVRQRESGKAPMQEGQPSENRKDEENTIRRHAGKHQISTRVASFILEKFALKREMRLR